MILSKVVDCQKKFKKFSKNKLLFVPFQDFLKPFINIYNCIIKNNWESTPIVPKLLYYPLIAIKI